MSEDVKSCPLCGSNKYSLFDKRTFMGHLVINRICDACGFVFLSPRMSEQELQDYYRSEYRRSYQGSEEPTPKDLSVQAERADTLLMRVKHKITRPAYYLDIGCSSGMLLQRFRDEYGCQVFGIEPGAAYRSFAQKSGLEVFVSLEELDQSGQPRFDLISMVHVLEHLPGPLEYLTRLREVYLQSSGWLLIEVPNLYAHDCFEIAHLSSFSRHTLAEMLRLAGFKVVAFFEHGAPRSRVIPLYMLVLAQPTSGPPEQESARPEGAVRLKRRLGLFRRRILERLFPGLAWLPTG